MADEKLTNRWMMVVAALVLQLCLGVLYAYSVPRPVLTGVYLADGLKASSPAAFESVIKLSGETSTDQFKVGAAVAKINGKLASKKDEDKALVAQLAPADVDALKKAAAAATKTAGYPYMASLFFFAVGMIFAGRWQDKAGPQKVAIVGGVLLAAGAALSGVIGPGSWQGMALAYGVLGGLGVGFAYVTPIATCIKWFPDMRGTITGLAVFGFGAGTLVFGPLISKLLVSVGFATTFYILGIVFLVAVCGAGSMFRVPPAGYKPAGWNPPAPAAGVAQKADWSPNEMMGTGQFWLLWIIYFFGAAAGLMIIGQAVPIGLEVAKLDRAVAAGGLGIMALLNGLGRLVHGSISDKLGRQKTVMLMFCEYIVAFILILPNADSFLKWLVGICIVGFSYGGYLALMPSITADYFGTKSLGTNYGYLFTAWGIAGLGGPFMIDSIKAATGAFTNAMYAITVACVAGLLLCFVSKRPVYKGA